MMCGIFGYVSVNGRGPSIGKLAQLAVNTESRGKHAHGLVWIDAAGRLRRYKGPGRISQNLECLERVRGARMVVGHCRFATRGQPSSANNHPHPSDGGWYVHNGTVFNYARLAFEWDLSPISDCDSEIIGLLAEEMQGSIIDRMQATVNILEGPACIIGLWTRPSRCVIVRRGKPLHISGDEKEVYLASLPSRLDNPYRIRNNTVRSIFVRHGLLAQTCDSVEPCQIRPSEKNPLLGRPLQGLARKPLIPKNLRFPPD